MTTSGLLPILGCGKSPSLWVSLKPSLKPNLIQILSQLSVCFYCIFYHLTVYVYFHSDSLSILMLILCILNTTTLKEESLCIATLGSSLNSKSKICSDESQSRLDYVEYKDPHPPTYLTLCVLDPILVSV